MHRKRILILGAGLAGLSAAWHLQKRGLSCRIFEKELEIGGLSRSRKINGFTFDHSGHLLHFKNRYTFNLAKNLLGDNLIQHQRNAWVYSHNRYIQYPFQANLSGLPPLAAKECLSGFIRASRDRYCKNKKDVNFLRWLNFTFGKGITKRFMVPYNNKFWTMPAQKLTCGWVDDFVPVPSLTQVIEGSAGKSQRQFGYNAHFWYFKKGGINQLPLALADQIKNIHTNCLVQEINLDKKEIKLTSGNKERFDYLISTVPLPELAHIIQGLPNPVASLFKKLRWNSIFNLNLGAEKINCAGRHWVYFPQKEISFFRVGFFHNFSAKLTPPKKNSLYAEVSYSESKPLDKAKIILRIREDLEKIGILPKAQTILAQDINDIKYGYPIYDLNYCRAREAILRYLMQNNIIPCGRYGSWRYMSMEDVILNGKNIADSV